MCGSSSAFCPQNLPRLMETVGGVPRNWGQKPRGCLKVNWPPTTPSSLYCSPPLSHPHTHNHSAKGTSVTTPEIRHSNLSQKIDAKLNTHYPKSSQGHSWIRRTETATHIPPKDGGENVPRTLFIIAENWRQSKNPITQKGCVHCVILLVEY